MQLHDHEHKRLQPTHFMTVYSKSSHNDNDYEERYMEIGPILKTENGYKIGASSPVSLDFLNDLAATIKIQNFKALRFKGLLPKNVLYCHSDSENPSLIWYIPKQQQMLYFSKSIRKESEVFEILDMVFVTHDGELYVYRLSSSFLLNEESLLYMVPLPNIYENCSVCLGNNKLKKATTLEQYMANMESLFYKTRFNALHHEKMGEGVIYTEAIKENDFRLFPYVPAPVKNIKELLNEIS